MSASRLVLFAIAMGAVLSGCMSMFVEDPEPDPVPVETLPDIDVALAGAARELIDYSGIASGDLVPVAVYCFLDSQEEESDLGWHIAREMNFAMSRADGGNGKISLIDVTDMEQVYKELARQQSALIDEATRVEMWKQVGAELIVSGSVKHSRKGYEVLAKLVEVETGRIRSQAKTEFNRKSLAIDIGSGGDEGVMFFNDLYELTDGLITEYDKMDSAIKSRDYSAAVDVDGRLYQIVVLLQDPSYIPSDADLGAYLAMAKEVEQAYIAVRSRLSSSTMDAAYRQMGNLTRMVNNWREAVRLHRW